MASAPVSTASLDITSIVQKHPVNLEAYEVFYKDLHQNPELSLQEYETAAKVAAWLRKLSADLEITTGIGGTGLIAVLRNGSGKTALLRADMDALPLLEKTGLDYASAKKMTDADGKLHPVMHACGHDFHVTCLLGAAEMLISCRQSWSGTLVFLFQPAEEEGVGARNMVDDGLYTRHGCPIPDVLLGQHVGPICAGVVATKPGPIMAATDGFKVIVHGKGGHASRPETCVDPVVVAAHIVVRLQSIVSREVPPSEKAVISVGVVHAGTVENIIPDEAELRLNIRSASKDWRLRILASIKRIINAECLAGNYPRDATIEPTRALPLTANDAETTKLVVEAFDSHFGPRNYHGMDSVTGSEDFSLLADAVKKPYCFWIYGGVEAENWKWHYAQGKLSDLPSNHSPFFAPAIHPTISTGIEALVVAALTFVGAPVANSI